MSDEMEPIHRYQEVLESLPGVIHTDVSPNPIGGIEPSHLSLGAEFADLPQVAIMRTDGGRENEVVYRTTIMFDRAADSFLSIEFLAWWVRDWARSGHCIQMRVRALPPRGYEIQLGRTLQFFIEYFMLTDAPMDVLPIFGEMADSIRDNMADHADCFEHPASPFDGVEASPGYTLNELKEIAESDADSAYMVARAYAIGESDIEPDQEEAFRWYAKAAELGHVTANFVMGREYLAGENLGLDFDKAYQHLKYAADNGMEFAIASIGELYMEGKGVEKDPAEGFRWYVKAAESENPVCFAELGECYEEGKGTPIDLEKALELYDSALNAGFEPVREALNRVRVALDLEPLE